MNNRYFEERKTRKTDRKELFETRNTRKNCRKA